jgi:hypothetical protein
MDTVVVIMGIEHKGLQAFKKVEILRPHVGELINDQDLIWQVKEVRLMTGKKHVGVALDPFGEETKAAVSDPTGELLKKAGWESFRPKAEQN